MMLPAPDMPHPTSLFVCIYPSVHSNLTLMCLHEPHSVSACRLPAPFLRFFAALMLLPFSQALWSQARERTQVLTIICANSSYAILKVRTQGWLVPQHMCLHYSLQRLVVYANLFAIQ